MSDSSIPLLDLRAQYARIRSEIGEAIERVLESQQFVLGPEVSALEEEIACYCGARSAVACASGSDAILLALMAHGVTRGDEVICPAYTFFATAGSIWRLGAVPVFADIDANSFEVTAETLRAAADRCSNLKAIVPVHLFGRAVPMSGVLALGEELGVPIVEDAAQAIGSRDPDGHRVGTRGSAGCFSFFPSKNLGGYGDGGIVTTNDEAIAERIRLLRAHGADAGHHHAQVGINSRLDAIQAAILRLKLGSLDAWNERRRSNAATYDRLLLDAGGAVGPGAFGPGASLALPVRLAAPAPAPGVHTFNQYVIRVPAEARDSLRAFLTEHDVGTAVYYPVPLHLQPCFRPLGWAAGDLPVSERASAETLALPVHPELTADQIQTVVGRIRQFFGG